MIVEALLSLSLAATPGIPDVPLSVDDTVWAGIHNDYLTPSHTDDGRSFGFKAGLNYSGVLFNYDFSGLTGHYTDNKDAGLRLDVNTFLLGYQIPIMENDLSGLTFTPAIGYVMQGNYGGAEGQNEFHRLLDEKTQHLGYESDNDFLFGSFLLAYEIRRRAIVHRSSFGYEWSEEERHWMFEILFGCDTDWFGVYAGIRHEQHEGADTLLQELIERLENGTRLVAGFNVTSHIHYRLSYNVDERYGSGEILFSF